MFFHHPAGKRRKVTSLLSTFFITSLVAMILTLPMASLSNAKAQELKLPQSVILKHEEILKQAEFEGAIEGATDWMSDIGASIEAGTGVGLVAGDPGGTTRLCKTAERGEEGAGTISATILSLIGIKGMRRRDGDIQFRVGYRQEPPPVLIRGSVPEECESEFRERVDKELEKLIQSLREPVTVTARQILDHLPLGGEGPARPLVIHKKIKFFDDEKEVSFTIPLGRIL